MPARGNRPNPRGMNDQRDRGRRKKITEQVSRGGTATILKQMTFQFLKPGWKTNFEMKQVTALNQASQSASKHS